MPFSGVLGGSVVSTFFVLLSLGIFTLLLCCARKLPLKSLPVFIFLFSCVVVGVIHYRVFMNGVIFGVNLDSLVIAIYSFIMFFRVALVPVTILQKRRLAIHTT